jgi:hypothetical protein
MWGILSVGNAESADSVHLDSSTRRSCDEEINEACAFIAGRSGVADGGASAARLLNEACVTDVICVRL